MDFLFDSPFRGWGQTINAVANCDHAGTLTDLKTSIFAADAWPMAKTWYGPLPHLRYSPPEVVKYGVYGDLIRIYPEP